MILRSCRKEDIPKIRRLYRSAFPRAERKPFWLIQGRSKKGAMEILTIEENGFAGLAIMMYHKENVLLDYFAVEEEKRGCGTGAKALHMLKEKYKDKRFLLEIELPDGKDDEIKIRRKNFYLRNGMGETGQKVILFGVPMEILTTGFDIDFDEYLDIYKNTLGMFAAYNVKKQL